MHALGAAFLFFPCVLCAQPGVLGNIIGEVRVTKLGFPPKAVLVNLVNRGATVNGAYTDGQGRFGFYSLPAGIYHLVINDDDYVLADEAVDLNPLITSTHYAQVTLNPKPPKKAGDDRVKGSNPNVVDLSELRQKFPKKAVKEYEKGLAARGDSNPEAAEKHFQKCLDLAPDFYPAHNELGSLYLSRGQFDEAEKEFSQAISLNRSDAEAHLNLANLQLLQKRYDAAEVSAQEGLRRAPNSAFGHFVLGSTYERSGRETEAERELRHSLELDPLMANVHLELVNLYLRQQQKSKAADELKAFLNAFPNDPRAPKAREVLAKLSK
jgi:tetratricopeptide (TPR) repeat protein